MTLENTYGYSNAGIRMRTQKKKYSLFIWRCLAGSDY